MIECVTIHSDTVCSHVYLCRRRLDGVVSHLEYLEGVCYVPERAGQSSDLIA